MKVKQYKVLGKHGEGTFSKVLKAVSIKTNKYVAIKCMKAKYKCYADVENLKEVKALKILSSHPCIITLLDILFDEASGRLAMVFEMLEMNLYELIKDRRKQLPEVLVKKYMFQLLRGLRFVHKNGLFHRDIKPENILVADERLKLADFGSCQNNFVKPPYTEYISTRWYRSPECLLTDGYYGEAMDIWGAGCVMFEIITLYPLFPGTNEMDQIRRIHEILGTPSKSLLKNFESLASHMEFDFVTVKGCGLATHLPNVSLDCITLLKKMVTYDPSRRITAKKGLLEPYFAEFLKTRKENVPVGERQKNKRAHGSKIASGNRAVPSRKVKLPAISVESKHTARVRKPRTQKQKQWTKKSQSKLIKTDATSYSNRVILPLLQGNSFAVGKMPSKHTKPSYKPRRNKDWSKIYSHN